MSSATATNITDITFKEPDADYFARPEVSNSDLGVISEYSAAHFKFWKQNPRAATPALDFGRLLHQIVLEPDLFKQAVVIGPDCDIRNKEWKDCVAAHPGKSIIRPEVYEKLINMRDEILSHPIASGLIQDSLKERVGVWTDSVYGVRCRMKVDGIVESKRLIFDLKTCESARADKFAKSVKNFGYARQNAFYLRGFEHLGFPMQGALNIAVEKSPPFGVCVFVTEDDVLAQGQREVVKALAHYAKCLKQNEWPGYPTEIQPLPFPAWGFTA